MSKPRVRRHGSIYSCKGKGHSGWGIDAETAYYNWLGNLRSAYIGELVAVGRAIKYGPARAG